MRPSFRNLLVASIALQALIFFFYALYRPAPLRGGPLREGWLQQPPQDTWTMALTPAPPNGPAQPRGAPAAYILTSSTNSRRYRFSAVRAAAAGMRPIAHLVTWLANDEHSTPPEKKASCAIKFGHANMWARFVADPAARNDDWAFFFEDEIAFTPPLTGASVQRAWRASVDSPAAREWGIIELGLCAQPPRPAAPSLPPRSTWDLLVAESDTAPAIFQHRTCSACLHALGLRKDIARDFLKRISYGNATHALADCSLATRIAAGLDAAPGITSLDTVKLSYCLSNLPGWPLIVTNRTAPDSPRNHHGVFFQDRTSFSSLLAIDDYGGRTRKNIQATDEEREQVGLAYADSTTTAGPNMALRDDGLLPYALCGSDAASDGAGKLLSRFSHSGRDFTLAVTAASAWGGASAAEPRVEFLAYYIPADASVCPTLGEGVPHCMIAPEVYPDVFCRAADKEWRRGEFSFPGRNHVIERAQQLSVFVLSCPGLDSDLVSAAGYGRTLVDVEIGSARSPLTTALCYQHVSVVHNVSACTEPFYGFNGRAPFWSGEPLYEGHTLFDAFIVYHTRVHGMAVTINDYKQETREIATRYLGPLVRYRGGWDFHGAGFASDHLDFEVLAEATCHWERRLDSRWVYILHAADNFAVPTEAGALIGDSLAHLDARAFSGAHVPIVQAFTRDEPLLASDNVLQRWPLIGDDLEFDDQRHTPVLNPRHFTHTFVHWNIGIVPSLSKPCLSPAEALFTLHLHTVHILALARPHLNKKAGTVDAWYAALAARLAEELKGAKSHRNTSSTAANASLGP
jgi:hypothetical protein